MDFAWFTYTIALMAMAMVAFAVNVTLWILASRRDCLAAGAIFFLYMLDTGAIFFDEYQRSKPVTDEYLGTGLTHPVFQVVVCCLLVSCVWLWCLLRMGERPRPRSVALLTLAILVVFAAVAPVGTQDGVVRMMAYWGLRDLGVIVALSWLGVRISRLADGGVARGDVPNRRWYVVALTLSIAMLVEDVTFIAIASPDLGTGWLHDFFWYLTERNMSENALVVVSAIASALQARSIMAVFSRHPTQSSEQLDSERVRPGFEARLLAFSDKRGLSAREREVLELVLKGEDNQGIASGLFISPGTVKAHLSRIYKKVGVPSRDALVNAFWRG